MTQKIDGHMLDAVAGAAIEKYRLVKLDGSTARQVVKTVAGEDPIGAVRAAVASGLDIAVELLNKAGTLILVANGAITVNALVYPAADGKVTATATGRAIGRAISSSSQDGDWIEVLPQHSDLFSDRVGLVTLFEDFLSWDSTFGPFIQTADAGATGTTAVTDAVGGVLTLFSDGDDNDEAYLHTITENFLFANNKPIWFEARLAIVEGSTNAAAVIIGLVSAAGADALQDTEAGPKSSYSGVVFWKVAGGLTLSAEVSIGGTQTPITLTGATYVSGTYYKFGILVVPTSSTLMNVYMYIDGVLVGSATGVTYTSATEMDAIVGVKSNGSAEENLLVDYIHVRQVR